MWIAAVVACAPSADLPTSGVTEGGLYALDLTPDVTPWVAGQAVDVAMKVRHEGVEVLKARVDVVPYMPDMGHGIEGDVAVVELGDGQYDASWLFPMPGYWELTIDVDAAPGRDELIVGFDVW